MSKRGLSAQDKKTKMLELLHETRDFFQLKDLEKIAPKSKGIVSQSVKEVLQELTDDGTVSFDKIGTSNYFWAFPSSAANVKANELEQKTAELARETAKIKALNSQLTDLRKGREDTDRRTELLEEHADLVAQSESYQAELARYGDADPALHQAKLDAGRVAKEEATRWTENVMTVLSWAKSQTGMDDESLRQHFGINETWEEAYS